MGLDHFKSAATLSRDAAKRTTHEHPIADGEVLDLGGYDRKLPAIYNDKATEVRFHTFLKTLDVAQAEQMIAKIALGETLTDTERRFQNEGLHKFNIQDAAAEKINGVLDDDEIQTIADHDPDLRAILDQTKDSTTAGNLVRTLLTELSTENATDFKRIGTKLKLLAKLENGEDSKRAEEITKNALEKFNITDEKYVEIVQSSMQLTGDNISADTRAKFDAFARAQMPWYAQVADKLPFIRGTGLRARTGELRSALIKEREIWQERAKIKENLGALLRGTIDPDTRLAIQEAMVLGGPIQRKKDQGLNTMREFRGIRDGIKEKTGFEARKQSLREFVAKEAAKLGKEVDQLGDEEKNIIKDGWSTVTDAAQQAEAKKHTFGGIFSALLAFFFPSKTQLRKEADTLWS